MPTDQEMTFIKYKTLNVIFFWRKKSTSKKEAGENGNKSMENKDTIDGRGGEQEASDHCGERLVSRSHEEIIHAGYHWEESWIKKFLN